MQCFGLQKDEFNFMQFILQQGYSLDIDDFLSKASQMSEDIFESQGDFEVTGNERTEKLGGRKVNSLLESKRVIFRSNGKCCC